MIEVILESLGKMSSNRSSFKYILASLQTNMAKSQISRVDIRIGKGGGGVDQSQTKNKLREAFFDNKLSKIIQKYENLCLKDTFGKNLQKKGTVYISGYLPVLPIQSNKQQRSKELFPSAECCHVDGKRH